MNKAFVREAEDETAPRCPRCHAIGQPVGPQTLAAHLPADAAANLATASTSFCPNPTCEVAYFDAHQQIALAALLPRLTWPKSDDPAAPLCPCLGVTAGDVIDDARRGDPTRIRQMLAAAAAHPHRCAAATLNARPCSGEAQRLYMKNLARS
jgi:hypothetical protein